MAKISLDVEDKNLATVLNIIENLKQGLIKNIDVENSSNNSNKKYLSKNAYKQKLQKQKVIEDEFLPKTTSSSKYLSPSEFKRRLKGN